MQITEMLYDNVKRQGQMTKIMSGRSHEDERRKRKEYV